MSDTVTLDGIRLLHWMNVRKATVDLIAVRTGIERETLTRLTNVDTGELPLADADRLADTLDIALDELRHRDGTPPCVIWHSRDAIMATRRPIDRGGIHFYNYYSLPAPKGQIAPVLIDILCPKDRMPTQNNGHLEPAITINLGPGDINGLWGHEVNEHTWHRFRANADPETRWVMGESYLEPSYCPHTYARAGDGPARILSYTVKSNLEPLVAATNRWSDDAFGELVRQLDERPCAAAALAAQMDRRGFDAVALADATGLSANAIAAFLEGDEAALGYDDLRAVGVRLGIDYRLLLRPDHRHDPVGKTWCSVEDSLASVRTYQSYTVASMSGAAQLSDLTGLFMKVAKPGPVGALDLVDCGCCHYLATAGTLDFGWIDRDGTHRTQPIAAGDALWVAPYVRHGFAGTGALIRMGNSEGITYLDQLEMSNTYALAATLRRARHDRQVWGYDVKKS